MVANTRIRYNDKQLWQMIHEHLVMSGMYKTADTLLKEGIGQDIVPLVDSSQFSSGPPVSEPSWPIRSRHLVT